MRKKLGEILLEAGVVDQFQLQAALGHQRQWGGRLGEIIVGKGFTTADAIADGLATQMGLPRVALGPDDLDPRAAQLLPEEMAERHGLVPFAIEGTGGDRSTTLIIATSDPTNLTALDEVQFRTGKRVKAAVATEAAVQAALRHVYHGEPLTQAEAPEAPHPPERTIELDAGPVAAATAPTPPAVGIGPDEGPLGGSDWNLDAGVSALGGAAGSPLAGGGDGLPEVDPEMLEEVDAEPVNDDAGWGVDADLDALGLGGSASAAPAAPTPAAAPAPADAAARPVVDDAQARAILDAIDALANGADAPAAVQRYVNPTQMVAALIRLLIRRGVIEETAIVEELQRK